MARINLKKSNLIRLKKQIKSLEHANCVIIEFRYSTVKTKHTDYVNMHKISLSEQSEEVMTERFLARCMPTSFHQK